MQGRATPATFARRVRRVRRDAGLLGQALSVCGAFRLKWIDRTVFCSVQRRTFAFAGLVQRARLGQQLACLGCRQRQCSQSRCEMQTVDDWAGQGGQYRRARFMSFADQGRRRIDPVLECVHLEQHGVRSHVETDPCAAAGRCGAFSVEQGLQQVRGLSRRALPRTVFTVDLGPSQSLTACTIASTRQAPRITQHILIGGTAFTGHLSRPFVHPFIIAFANPALVSRETISVVFRSSPEPHGKKTL